MAEIEMFEKRNQLGENLDEQHNQLILLFALLAIQAS